MHPDDSVAIALQALAIDDRIDRRLKSRGDIPVGHKVAVHDIGEGDPIRKYGHVIGIASRAIRAGEHVHTHNLAYTDDVPGEAPSTRGDGDGAEAASPGLPSFPGYRRADGCVGTRNYVGVMATVNCSATVVSRIVRHFEHPADARASGVDGVVAVTHQSGCGIPAGGGVELSVLQRVLRGYLRHPNFGGWLVVGLGCEVNQLPELVGATPSGGAPVRTLKIQEAGGTRAAIDSGIGLVGELIAAASDVNRRPAPLSALRVGLQCGGSDGWSGVTANPALGNAVDRLVAAGAAAILAETPEIHGAEGLLKRRAVDAGVAARLQSRVDWWHDYLARHGQNLSGNPSPGNLAGGITTILEKSLGAVAKSGSAPLRGVLDYAEALEGPGLWFMDSPGYDPCSVTGEVAAGANLICFTTGRGSTFGATGAPTVKIASNSELFTRMRDDMDVDCGGIANGEDTIEAAGGRLFRTIVDVASGKRTNSEKHGLGTFEFVPWSQGAVV
ncbi:MAG: altronate dehydratase family protein [Proteobacteria bacterium]|nr:altronate dehydratase family protein [Pseudomonadota bacterium]